MDKFDADFSSRFIINFVFAAHTLQTCKLMLSASNFPEERSFTPQSHWNFMQNCMKNNLKFDDRINEV